MNVYKRLLRIIKHRGEDLLLFEIVLRGANVLLGAIIVFVISSVIEIKTGVAPINGEFLKWIDGTYLAILSLSTFILLFFALIEIVGLVHISHSYERGERPTILQSIKFSFRKALGLLHAYGLTAILCIFFAFILFPILQIGPSVFRSFSIPSFITDEFVVSNTAALFYVAGIVFILFVIYRLIFTFHVYATRNISLIAAAKASWIITSKRKSLRELIAWSVLAPVAVSVLLIVLSAVCAIVIFSICNALFVLLASILPTQAFLLFYSVWMFIVTALVSVSVAPFVISVLTAYLEIRNPIVLGIDSARHHTYDSPFFRNRFFAWLFRKKKNIVVFGIIIFFIFTFVARAYLQIFEFTSKTPIVIAHRGLTGGAFNETNIENKVQTFENAILTKGVQGIETDLQMLADGTVVLFHDQFIKIDGKSRELSLLTYDELLKQNIVLSRLEDLFKSKVFNCKATWLLEIKNYTPVSVQDIIAEQVYKNISRKNMKSCVYVGSFNVDALTHFKHRFPSMLTNLYLFNQVGNSVSYIDVSKIDALSIEESLKSKRIVKEFVQNQKNVFVWTVNNPKNVPAFIDLGITGIITDTTDDIFAKLADLDGYIGNAGGDQVRVIELFGKTFIFDPREVLRFKIKYSI